MKKIAYFLLSALITCTALGMVACGGNAGESDTTLNNESSTSEKTSEKETTTENNDKVTYTVKVVDVDGNAIAGAMVQICDEACIPAVTDANGVATFKVTEGNYKASMLEMTAGYEYNGSSDPIYFEDATEVTITLKKVAE